MVHSHNRILHNSENEQSVRTEKNVNESQKNNVDNRSHTHEVILYDSIYITNTKLTKLIAADRYQDGGYPFAGK